MSKGNQKGKGTAKQVASYVPKKNRCDVFLSYRRADGRDLTGRIKDKLALKLLSVFYDYDSLKDGKFNLKIIDAIYSCDDFVLVMTPRIFENCTDENNWIMLEIRTAIKYNKHIIPVFVEDTGKALEGGIWTGWNKDLPQDVREQIEHEHVLVFRPDDDFKHSVSKIYERLYSRKKSKRRIISLLICLCAIIGLGFWSGISSVVDSVSSYTNVTSSIPDYEYVDLGLSVKWATCNVGASSPIEKGYAFSWGEIIVGKYHNWESYKYSREKSSYITKYCDNETQGIVDRRMTLELSDDAANYYLGSKWRIPTKNELQELLSKCIWQKEKNNNVEGYRVIGKNGNSIFIPITGHLETVKQSSGNDTINTLVKVHITTRICNLQNGYYWTNALDVNDSKNAWGMFIDDDLKALTTFPRYKGLYIRPVYNNQ